MRTALLPLAFLAAAPLATAQSELLISEVVITPTSGEFIEIYNPGPSAVDLSDVYLTDATFAGNSAYYYNIVTEGCQDGDPATDCDAGGGGFFDFHARFPDGASIGPDEYQTVAIAGSDGFTNAYGVAPTYELYDDGGAADGVPQMREASPGSINGQGGLTNSGEVAVLYYWNGASDLVTDLDYVLWGDQAEAVDKSGVAIDGPDPDAATSTYNDEVATSAQAFLAPHATGAAFTRTDFDEGTEATTGGNGVSGEDETSENLMDTFSIDLAPTPNEGLPTVQTITVGFAGTSGAAGEDDSPATVGIGVTLSTNDGQPSERSVSVQVDLTGGTAGADDFTDVPPSFRIVTFDAGTASGTSVDAVYTLFDDGDEEGTEEADFTLSDGVGGDPDALGDASFTLTILDDDTPIVVPDVVINEVDADQAGTDAAEFVELFNTGVTDVDLDDLVLVFYNGSDDASYAAYDLDGGTITGGGYFVICGNAAEVPSCDLEIAPATNLVQNGEDAVALHVGSAAGFPNDTPASTVDLVDAVVYETGPDSDSNLPTLLGTGTVIDENANANGSLESVQRFPDGFGPFTTDTATPGAQNIPVELAAPLAAVEEAGALVLSWSTASETNNAYFEVLARGAAGGPFASLGRVDGAGTTAAPRQYTLRTGDLAPGTYTLRLRQVDLDGAAAVVSETEASISLAGTHRVSAVAPNPSAGAARLTVAAARSQRVTVAVYDALGRLVATALVGDLVAEQSLTVEVGDALAPGAYVAVVAGEQFREVRRFTVSR